MGISGIQTGEAEDYHSLSKRILPSFFSALLIFFPCPLRILVRSHDQNGCTVSALCVFLLPLSVGPLMMQLHAMIAEYPE